MCGTCEIFFLEICISVIINLQYSTGFYFRGMECPLFLEIEYGKKIIAT